MQLVLLPPLFKPRKFDNYSRQNLFKQEEVIPKMEFCPKCGTILIQKRKNYGCPRCNYSLKNKFVLKTSEKIVEKNKGVVISREIKGIHPIVNEKCKKCEHEQAYFWTVQTRASDESETKFFKCVKCHHVWREYR